MQKTTILTFLTLLFNTAFAQLSFDHLSITSGLSQSTVLAIHKDSRGYMWFGTRDCLNRYDGRNIKVYKTDPNNPSSISGNDYIYAIHEDQAKTLWIGTQSGLNRYIPETDSFERILFSKTNPQSISDIIVLSIASGNNGRIWFGTNNGLNLLKNPSSRAFRKFFKKDGLAGDAIYTVMEDSKGNVWVGTTSGLTLMTPEKDKYRFTTFRHSVTDSKSISSNSVKTIVEDKSGNIWIGTETEGLNLFVPESNSFIRFKHDPLNPNSLSNNIIRKILLNKNGNLWIATMNGLNVMDLKTKTFVVHRHDSDNNKSLSDNSIKDIYQDNHGSVWIGTMFGGVNVTHLSTIPFSIEKHSKYRNSVSSDIISVIAADKRGNLLIGTEGQGLNYYDINTRTFKNYIHNPLNANSLGSNTIKSIYRDSKGQIWIGLFQGGLQLFDPSNAKFTSYKPDERNPKAISQGYVSSITEDKKGRLWVGTSSRGINLFDAATQSFTVVNSTATAGLKLSSNYIRVVFADSKNNLWVGTANGLNLLKNNASQFKYFYKNLGSENDLQSSHINCVKEDSRGNIWIGSYHGGLSLYQPKTASFLTFNTSHGLASDNIIDILEDNEGYLWISTDRGLSKFDTKRKTFKNYTTRDGLPANEFNYQSAYKNKDGKLYFGSYNGLVSFIPQEIEENKNIPKVAFSDLKLFNKPVAINGPDELLTRDISLTEEITFKANQNIFTIEFLALNYIKPERNRFAYKLEGFEKDWNYVNIPSATYTNLPPGKYSLLVKASNNDGLWNEDPAKLIIRVLPPLWKTWWAYLFYLIVISVVLFFVIRFFRRQARLETELYYEHLNNENLEKLYQLKLDFFTRISHEIRTPLTLIFAPLESLIKNTVDNSVINKPLIQIKNNTDRLLRLISELLDFRKIESGNMNIIVSEQNLVSFCEPIVDSFRIIASQKRITFEFNYDNEYLSAFFDGTQMEKVLYNLLSNAFKYTPDGGKISLTIAEEQDVIYISVSDNGIGIPYEDQANIFTNFYQSNHASAKKEGWGIGLALVKSIVELHHGEISVSSMPQQEGEKGHTVFKFSLKKGSGSFDQHQIISQSFHKDDLTITTVSETQQEVLLVDDTEPSVKKHTILIVEDNDELRAFISESLEKDYHVVEAENGLVGWEKAVESIPDIIISDVNMPVMDGMEFCAKVKVEERTSHIPIIMLTAMADNIHQIDGLTAGANVYLTKPFSLQVLELSVRNVLVSRDALKEKYSKQVMLMPKKLEIQSPDEKFLNKLMQLVEDNMEDPEFNVSSLVNDIGMSQTVLYKKIKALTDMTITDFIKSQRLKRAAQLLLENKLNISEVAYAVGFNDRKYFSKEFKKQFGKAPTEFIGEQ